MLSRKSRTQSLHDSVNQLKLSVTIAAHKCIIQSQQTCTLIMQDLVVKRIDEGLGLILEVPSEPAVTPGFVHISNVGDTKVNKLQQVGLRLCADLLPTIS